MRKTQHKGEELAGRAELRRIEAKLAKKAGRCPVCKWPTALCACPEGNGP